MKANKLQSTWIMARSLATTLYWSTQALVISYTRKNTPDLRDKMNQVIHSWCKQLLRIINLSYQVHDPYHLTLDPTRHYIIMSNHTSHYDIPLILLTFPGTVRMIAKKELFKVPVWGHAMKAAEFITIDRENRMQAIKDLEEAKKKMQSGILPWIAPEGTRSRTGKLQTFKKGGFMIALETQAIIIPVNIQGTFQILPPKTWNFHTHEKAHIYIGKPIDTTQYSLKTRNQLVKDVRQEIETLAQQASID